MDYAEAYGGTPHKESRGLTLRLRKKAISGWKLSRPAAHQVEVQMENELVPAPLHIEDQFVTAPGDACLVRQLLGRHQEFGHHGPILFGKIIDTSDMLFGDDQNMNRRMGMDVFEGDDRFTSKHIICGLFASNDPAKNAVAVHTCSGRYGKEEE
jgi:hypothetical protein